MIFFFFFFFFNDTATTEIYTLSLHDALPIEQWPAVVVHSRCPLHHGLEELDVLMEDRKSTRLNSSHVRISYAVFCLKKKKKKNNMFYLKKKKKKIKKKYNIKSIN